MISMLRTAAIRASSRVVVGRAVALSAVRAPSTPAVFTLRHFSAPPIFLDASEVTDRILTIVKNFDQVDPAKVSPTTKFADDLGLDSLDIVEVVMAIEDEFAIEIPDQEADKITSIAEAIEYISTHPMAK
eukprot:scaffold3806_cov169-Amphora_coffeaeformis.AAC.5